MMIAMFPVPFLGPVFSKTKRHKICCFKTCYVCENSECVHIGVSPKIQYIYCGIAKYVIKVAKSQEEFLENFMQQNTTFMQQNTKNCDKNANLARVCSKIWVF